MKKSALDDRFKKIEDMLQAIIGVSYQELAEKQEINTQQTKQIHFLEAELKKAKNIANALTSCNEALVRSTSEEQFLLQICELIVKSGAYQLVWIGFAQHDEHKSIHPVAHYGFEYGYLEKINLTWDENSERGQGPTAKAIRNRSPETANDLANDPQYAHCREEAIKRGYAASIALPIVIDEEDNEKENVGVLTIYSKEPASFNTDEIILLSGMAKDIANNISSIRRTNRNLDMEKRNQMEYRSRLVISNLLETALKPLNLSRMLEACLELILSIPWISIMSKGSIFIYDEETNLLKMATQRGLSTPLLKLCQNIELGYCLCGRAAQSRKLVFSSCLDERHDVRFEGITEHGHYCLPIMAEESLLGVLNLYVAHNHQNNPEQEQFLNTVANTLAGIIKRKSADERIYILANTDSLTNIPNRRAFMEHLDHEVARSKRDKLTFAVMYMDLDKFKQVNDVLGHKAGDLLLIQTVKRIKHILRETDTMGRIGGDEFTIILPNSDYLAVEFVAEKIIKSVNQPFTIEGNEVRIGISIGCSLYPEHALSGEDLLRKADKALYVVKSRGKNHILPYQEQFESMQD